MDVAIQEKRMMYNAMKSTSRKEEYLGVKFKSHKSNVQDQRKSSASDGHDRNMPLGCLWWALTTKQD